VEPLEKIHVEGVAKIANVGLVTVRPVVVHVNLNVLTLAKCPRPSAQNVSAGKDGSSVNRLRKGRCIINELYVVAGPLVVNIALQREGIAGALDPIDSESTSSGSPCVIVVSVRVEIPSCG
jgi:hypothetical protein